MSTDMEKSTDLVRAHPPKESEPVYGHEHTSFEATDARAGIVIWSLAIIGGTLVIVFAMTIGIQKWLQQANPAGQGASPLSPARVIPPAPQLQVHPWEELPEMRAHEAQILNSYGKDPDGRYHVPVSVAMSQVLPTLKMTPNAPAGITTPGGEGRDFANSLKNMPRPYQGPQIRGEIEKHAQ